MSIRDWNAAGTSLNFVGMSERKTPDSRHSTCPPMYVSASSQCPSKNPFGGSTCLFGHTMFPRNASTMRRLSHSVPEPFRSTSSGPIGMIVQSEKTKLWTYLQYR